MFKIQKIFAALLFWLLLNTLGCDSSPERVAVTGRVLIDGKPLTSGYVRVLPNNARMSQGMLDSEGRFTLTAKKPLDGVVPGIHPVEIIAVEQVNAETKRRLIPAQYEDHAASKLCVEIPGPTKDLLINLTWEGSGKKGPYLEKVEKE